MTVSEFLSVLFFSGNVRVSENSDRYERSSSSGNQRRLPEVSSNSRYRGLKCDLPDDFLRVHIGSFIRGSF